MVVFFLEHTVLAYRRYVVRNVIRGLGVTYGRGGGGGGGGRGRGGGHESVMVCKKITNNKLYCILLNLLR